MPEIEYYINVADLNGRVAATGESNADMAPWGQDSSAETRDVTHVLLSPRMGGANSPLNRKMPLKKGGETESHTVFGFFQSNTYEGGEHPLNDDGGNGDFHKLPSFKSTQVEQLGLLGDIYKTSLAMFSRQFSMQRKKSAKYSAFYVFASLVFMFFLVKISSVGWLAVQSHSPPSPKVHTTSFHINLLEL